MVRMVLVPLPSAIINMIPGVLEMRENIKWDRGMDKSTIIAKLREHESELKAAGI